MKRKSSRDWQSIIIHRHTMHCWENLWGFYPLYGFVGGVVLVIVATWMRSLIM